MRKTSVNNHNKDIVRSISGFYNGKRVFVTGHTGFKGSWLSLWLVKLGAKVTGFALDPPTEPNLFTQAEITYEIEDVRGDIRNFTYLKEVLYRIEPEIIFHLAAQPLVRRSYAEPKETFDVNVGGTVNLLDVARGCPGARAIVVITSDKCYENREWVHAYRETDRLGGHDPYSASKAATEIICHSYFRSFFRDVHVGLATTRAGNVIGGGDWAVDRIVPDIVRAISEGRPVPIRKPNAVRPWQHVLEPLWGYLMLGVRLFFDPERFSEPWNFAPADGYRTVRNLVDTFLNAYGTGSWEDISGSEKMKCHEAHLLKLAWDKAYHLLDWQPRWNFSETVKKTSLWYWRLNKGESAKVLCLEEISAYMESLKRREV